MTTAPRADGFTVIEMATVVAILGIIAAIGYPGMSNWLLTRRAQAAASYYMEGLSLARNMAIEHNSASRFVLSQNASTGQMEWQIDICFPTSAARCDDTNGTWSTLTTAVNDPLGAAFKSVTRSAAGMPASNQIQLTLAPTGQTSAYFTPLGWVDTTVSPQLNRVVVAPASTRTGAFAPTAVALTLAGVASRCDPAASGVNPRRCP
jgi:type IV fimbrial biogenesis protein FimT